MTQKSLAKSTRKNKIEMIGKKFGRLVVLEKIGSNKGKKLLYRCRCDCGNIRIVVGVNLRNGNTKSCGCFKRDVSIVHGMCETLEYQTWEAMIQRCNNPNNINYHRYGGKGISVCPKWINSFTAFYADMGSRPNKKYSIERINNTRNYESSNCIWATRLEQSQNQQLRKDNKTGFRGICWEKRYQKYLVQIAANGQNHYIGRFSALEAAKTARQEAEQKYWKKNDTT